MGVLGVACALGGGLGGGMAVWGEGEVCGGAL